MSADLYSPFRANPSAIMQLTRSALIASQLEALYQVGRILAEEGNLTAVLDGVLEAVEKMGGMSKSIITLSDPETGRLLVRAVHDSNEGFAPLGGDDIVYRPGEGVMGSIMQNGNTFICELPANEQRFLHRLGLLDPTLPFIGVPLFLDAKPIGVLAAQPVFGNRAFLREQAHFLEMVANLVSQKVRSNQRYEQLQALLSSQAVGRSTTAMSTAIRIENERSGMQPVLLGKAASMKQVVNMALKAAQFDSTVLVLGESGTGKELVANTVHYNSARASRPFVKVNCASLSDNLLESELFGHEKGAFTGAIATRKGRFEMADGGTLFLDEIGEISPSFQAKLLRVLQEGEFERVGGARTIKVNVRVVAATNRDLSAEVQKGNFRADLFYRLHVLPIEIPALRERMEDLPLLTEALLERISTKQHRPLSITKEALRRLMMYEWAGNVRELENCLERAAVLSDEGHIDASHIIFSSGANREPMPALTNHRIHNASSCALPSSADLSDPTLEERERVMGALEQSGWVQAKAARLLGMTPRQVAYRIKILNIPMRTL
ncbi:transcriptional regulator, NifA, Fis Family [Magnetococcus marinus MC-1]|uniref:Nif-specific regulatory protein n=1 Tax=Magnetococcus marinus (strain ATCC BAA-1437 / JCM 17883 / MC-1) TaxID=156889 RepID=A0L6X2_MAGMM|nr:nif-specific transcriptional activator NifA [Magnetococcus marinus]ABK43715.1 transcriptional regulator, NifA, Fis Family [Magnetococcus marinus MC-1]